ncbi:DUF433 domain-containing protein [Chroococcidiopsis sp. CCMEE 29]|uniref:DUF433 domain-containing protein n=1 Tax=Chroococcidiopsis sp. CCMEE 29 TaxID=155894 RepID=UPI00201FFBE4|nr:DUF433 domain-containing protein [Chroococcidiopsis sp. CCMEE 29]
MFNSLVSQEHIEISPAVRGGKPRIVGTRIAVEDVAVMHLKMAYSLMEIAGKYNLALSSVYAAMAYYFDHREEIDRRMEEDDELVAALKRNHPSRLQQKLRLLRSE